ncbi:MAG: cation transporter [Oscillibacter sp.]|nr:cation transporter [Oscillibacter sp.]
MKKRYKLSDLCCANCAAKIEDGIRKIPGVKDANLNFMAQKLTIDADDERFDEIMKEVIQVAHKVEPECVIHV